MYQRFYEDGSLTGGHFLVAKYLQHAPSIYNDLQEVPQNTRDMAATRNAGIGVADMASASRPATAQSCPPARSPHEQYDIAERTCANRTGVSTK
jgi:hypothetical protein